MRRLTIHDSNHDIATVHLQLRTMNLDNRTCGASHIGALACNLAGDTGGMESGPNMQERLFEHGNQMGCFVGSGGLLLFHGQVDLFSIRIRVHTLSGFVLRISF